MAAQTARTRSPFSDSTKLRIIQEVKNHPGQKAREIAKKLGLDRSMVSAFLHREGKEKHGLLQQNYCWYSRTAAPRPAPNPLPDQSICGTLTRLPITQATIKIRSLSLEIVQLAFEEDEYSLLDDRLKAELAQRLAKLENPTTAPIKRSSSPSWVVWIAIIFSSLWLFTTLNNQQRPQGGNTAPSYSR